MSKKWFLTMSSILLAAMLTVGCTADEPDPAPPVDDENGTETPLDDTNQGDNNNNIDDGDQTVPGVDEDDTLMDDDEDDAQPDSEDIIEDPEDADPDNRDE